MLGAGALFLSLSFLISVGALFVFILSLMKGQVFTSRSDAAVIYGEKELGKPEESVVEQPFQENWAELDQTARRPVLLWLCSAVFWLVLGSLFGVVSSLKLHWPDLWVSSSFLTFGRIRPVHLNMITYGWLSMAGIGLCLWLVPRLTKAKLEGAVFITLAGVLWNVFLVLGVSGIFAGVTDGMEWLEIYWPFDIGLATAGAFVAVAVFLSLKKRKTKHVYVSLWYILGGFVWFPFLFIIANIPYLHQGVEQAIANWWFAHNVLGLWLTPLGLSLAYYLIPKVTGAPIYSYQLSLFGFWGLAFFYAQVGMHHMIGGPIPTWLANLSIVMSIGMVIPVTTVAINHHVSMRGYFKLLKTSHVLRFTVFGAMMYTVSSLQGSLHAIRELNYVSHFTHWTVSHAHLGAYGFTSMVLFGALYFAIPRLLQRDWPYPKWISWHFFMSASGVLIYAVFLGIGGILQGLELRDSHGSFQQSVLVTLPYLYARSLGGTLMTFAHFLFAAHFVAMLRKNTVTLPARDQTPAQVPSEVTP